MKNAICILVLACLVTSCSDLDKNSIRVKSDEILIGSGMCKKDFSVIKLDGCEYYYHTEAHSATLCHKGNCSNPIHNMNLEK